MSELQAAGVIVLLFALRCLVPLALTLVIGYLMNRQVDRWAAEDAAAAATPAGTPAPQPCWVARNCSPARRSGCPAYLRQGQPCWQARQAVDGGLPAGCPTCPVYVAGALA